MPRRRAVPALALLVSLALGAGSAAARDIAPEDFQALRFRLAGPHRAGWATQVAGVPGVASTFYFGSADGGVWKTTDAGVTWRSLFDHQGSASIGALALAPSDPDVVWVGTGQIQQRWDIVDGDGVYRSTDGGESFTHVGLEATKHVGAIWVDPTRPEVAVVAALGHVFGPNPERGLFRTEDGGKSWAHVLDRGPDVGAADLAGDPKVPGTIYGTLWQVRRHPWLDYFQPPVGPGSGVVRSSDGGRTWSDCGRDTLPAADLGRIELAVVPGTGAKSVWAVVHAASGGSLYRTDDACASWKLVNSDRALASAYMSGVFADPNAPDTIWVLSQALRRSRDGGRTLEFVKSSPGGDDYHHLWIDPTDSRRMIVGADQGAVVTLNGGESWSSWYNQPTGQFYRLATDDEFPYRIYSGQQDNGTVSIASRSDFGRITFRDWHPVGADERDGDVPDPADPDVVYGAGLGGRITRWNAVTAQSQNVAPWPVASYGNRPGTSRWRYDWITPLAISKLAPHAIYTAAQSLFRSTDGGSTWDVASGDLTGAVEGAKECDGDVPLERATACGWGTIFAIGPSPVDAGVVWVGTTNGRVQVTRDGGKSWSDVTPPGLGDWSKVNFVDASAHDAGSAYVSADRHRVDDPRPIAFRTHDFGRTWTAIGDGLPANQWVGVVRQDPVVANLLYAGTNRGVFVSFDDGARWLPLRAGLPTSGVNDLVVHGDDVVVATQGRAIWILDDVAPLRFLAREGAPAGLALAPPEKAFRVRFNQNKDTPLPPEEPTGENPPAGAVFDYFVPASTPGPVTLEIFDAAGRRVRRFASDDAPDASPARVYFTERYLGPPERLAAAPGHRRFVWNLRGERPRALDFDYSIAAIQDHETERLPAGAYVVPGRYRARLAAGGAAVERGFEVGPDPRLAPAPGELEALDTFYREVAAALARSADLAEAREERTARWDAARAAAKGKRFEKAVSDARAKLAALDAASASPARVNGELTALATDLEHADRAPTRAQRQLLAESSAALDRYAPAWRALDRATLTPLAGRLERAGL